VVLTARPRPASAQGRAGHLERRFACGFGDLLVGVCRTDLGECLARLRGQQPPRHLEHRVFPTGGHYPKEPP
jgi:hypothetical protein